jgi:hypothetical protein
VAALVARVRIFSLSLSLANEFFFLGIINGFSSPSVQLTGVIQSKL